MLQPQELRIGNYVDVLGKIDQVKSIEENEHGGFCKFKENPYQYYLIHNGEEIVKPIPLTEEILIKAGFEKDLHCGYESVYHHKNFDLCIYNKIGTLGFELHEVEGFTINHEPFFNLHQLQNLFFSLYGEELTVK